MNATSNVVKVTIKRPTALTAAVTPAHPAVNQTWTLSGQLTTGASGLANQIIKLEWSTDNVTWRSSTATNTTNTTGGYRFLLSTPSAGTYYERAAYAGTSVYASAASKGVKVVVS